MTAPRNPIARWAARAPRWQWFLYFAATFGGLTWALQPHQTFVAPVVGGLVFGLLMTWVWMAYRRWDQAASGVSTDETAELDRAIAHGVVPEDPQRRAAMVNLVEHRRRQCRAMRVYGPVVITLLLALSVALVFTDGLWPHLLYAIVLAAFDALTVLQLPRQLRKLDRMTALLARHQ